MSSHFNDKPEERSMENTAFWVSLPTIVGTFFFKLIKETTEQMQSNNSVFKFLNDRCSPI